jgi:hypothetical protein
MYVTRVLTSKVAAAIYAGFVFGILVLIITSIDTPKANCGDTIVGIGCAANQVQQEIFSNITLLTISITIIISILSSLKLRHTIVFSTLGAAATISILSLYQNSDLFYKSYVGSVSYSLLASFFFCCSYLLFNKIIWKSEQ